MRVAVIASHPVQYQAPLFRQLGKDVSLEVFFAHRSTPRDQANAGFGVEFNWDIDLTTGFVAHFLTNVSRTPGTDHFTGCDTPSIRGLVERGEFDALIVMGWHLKCYWQAIWAAKAARIPVLIRGDSQLETPRSAFKRIAKEIVYPRALRAFDAAFYVGERSRAYWEHFSFPLERLFFSPHCVDTGWFAERSDAAVRQILRQSLGISEGAKVILFAGKLVPFKRPNDIISAAIACGAKGYPLELMVAGDGELRPDLEACAAASGIRLHTLGFCNQSRMPAVYAAADCLVLPSNGRETWGLVANESIACGTPVIVSDACGCAPDLAGDGLAGCTYPCGDIGALASALQNVLINPPDQKSIAAKSSAYDLKAASDGIMQGLNFVCGNASVLSGGNRN